MAHASSIDEGKDATHVKEEVKTHGAEIPLGNGSESTKGSTRSRHRPHMLSLGDASFLASLDVGVNPAGRDHDTYRTSGFQFYKQPTPDDDKV